MAKQFFLLKIFSPVSCKPKFLCCVCLLDFTWAKLFSILILLVSATEGAAVSAESEDRGFFFLCHSVVMQNIHSDWCHRSETTLVDFHIGQVFISGAIL